jgi:hypothetical protein
MINSNLRSLSSTVELDPREWSLFNTEAPDIIDSLLSCVTSKDKKVWFRENNRVSISPSWSRSYDWHNHPLSLIFTISHI